MARTARRLGIKLVPVEVLAQEEAEGILKLIHVANARSLNILEQAPYDNAVAESFMKTYKYDEVYLSDYESFGEALQNTGRFIDDVYNAKRLHSSLGYVPPNEYEENWLREQGYALTLPGSEKCLLTNLNAGNSAENLETGGILATI